MPGFLSRPGAGKATQRTTLAKLRQARREVRHLREQLASEARDAETLADALVRACQGDVGRAVERIVSAEKRPRPDGLVGARWQIALRRMYDAPNPLRSAFITANSSV